MTRLKRRSSFEDADHQPRASNKPRQPLTTCDTDTDKRPPGVRRRFVYKGWKVGDYMFKSGPLSTRSPAHPTAAGPSSSKNRAPSVPHISLSAAPDVHPVHSTTRSLSMPRSDNFEGLTSPLFPPEAYYFPARTTSPTAKRPSKNQPRSSLSTESTSTSKNDTPGQTSLARAHSTSSRRPGTATTATARTTTTTKTANRRPSTAGSPFTFGAPVEQRMVKRDPQVHSAASNDIQPAIAAAEDATKSGKHSLESTISAHTNTMPRFVIKNGKRHHPYPSSKAPYPRSYDSTVIDQSVFPPAVSSLHSYSRL